MSRLPLLMLALLAGCATAPDQPATAYEGARVIVGDGRVIENATLLVRGEKLVEVGRDVRVPEGATRRIDGRIDGSLVVRAMVRRDERIAASLTLFQSHRDV